MATVTSCTVKKFDGTTDITFTALRGAAAGDPALWRQDNGQPATLPVGLRPTIRTWSKPSGDGRSQVITVRGDFPAAVLDSTTGRYQKYGVVPVTLTATLPNDVPLDAQQEAIYQFIHLLNAGSNAGFPGKAMIVTGHAPT